MEVDPTPEGDLDKAPNKAKGQDADAVKEDGLPMKEEQIVTKGMLLVGGREEMEGEHLDTFCKSWERKLTLIPRDLSAKRSLFVADTLHVQIHSLSAFRITASFQIRT